MRSLSPQERSRNLSPTATSGEGTTSKGASPGSDKRRRLQTGLSFLRRSKSNPKLIGPDERGAVMAYDHVDDEDARWWESRLFRLLSSPLAGRAAQGRLNVGRVTVDVLAAAELAAADLSGTSDPYVVVTVTGYGASKLRPEWPAVCRQTGKTAVVQRCLNPTWAGERFALDAWRHGAVLRATVFDHDVGEAHDLLGTVEIPLDAYAGAGAVERWFGFSDGRQGGVLLRVDYDVDALAEACSVLWMPVQPDRFMPKFHANAFYAHAMEIKAYAAPAARAAEAALAAVTWKDFRVSTMALCVCVALACVTTNYGVLVHGLVAAGLTRTYAVHRAAVARDEALSKLFQKMDSDGSGKIDFGELREALGVAARLARRPPPARADVKRLFEKYATGAANDRGVDEAAFRELEGELEREHLFPDLALEEGSSSPTPPWPQFTRSASQVRAAVTTLPDKMKKKRKRTKRNKKEKSEDDARGPLKGMLLRTFNGACRSGAGDQLSRAQHQFCIARRQLAFFYRLLSWGDFERTAALFVANVLLAVAHGLFPPTRVMPFCVLGAFFGLTQCCVACEIVAFRGPAAVRRYVALRRGLPKPTSRARRPSRFFSQILKGKEKSMVVTSGSTTAVREDLGKTVAAIFKKIDDDGSGSLDLGELRAYVSASVPRGGDVDATLRKLDGALAAFDEDGNGELDVNEFTRVILGSEDVAELLLTSDLDAQLGSGDGVTVVKFPSKIPFALPSGLSGALRCHGSAVAVRSTIRGHDFVFARRSRRWVQLPMDQVTNIAPLEDRPHILAVEYLDMVRTGAIVGGPRARRLLFGVANPFFCAALASALNERRARSGAPDTPSQPEPAIVVRSPRRATSPTPPRP